MKNGHSQQEINGGTDVIKTAKGDIEYSVSGAHGPFLVGIHGGPGGYDQIQAVYPDMYNKGFRILAWSRPGYLRTPLAVGETFREQADALAMLMDALEIETAALLAFSAGGASGARMCTAAPGSHMGAHFGKYGQLPVGYQSS